MKLKNKYKLLTLLSFGAIMLLNLSNSYAVVTMEPYELIGTNPENIANGSEPAYIITGSEYFPDGTILYKQTYYDVTYYSPKPPEHSVEVTV